MKKQTAKDLIKQQQKQHPKTKTKRQHQKQHKPNNNCCCMVLFCPFVVQTDKTTTYNSTLWFYIPVSNAYFCQPRSNLQHFPCFDMMTERKITNSFNTSIHIYKNVPISVKCATVKPVLSGHSKIDKTQIADLNDKW